MTQKLIRDDQSTSDPILKIFKNRKVNPNQIRYFENLDELTFQICDPVLFGEDLIEKAQQIFKSHYVRGDDWGLIVDCDCDGYTAAALFYNYVLQAFPSQIDKVKIYMHDGKQHGLNDIYKLMIADDIKMCICPDGGSNDYDAQWKLLDNDIDIIILDHHCCDMENEELPDYSHKKGFALINNQTTDYPNKDLSGVGVVWQFCRYIDEQEAICFSKNFLDLVAIGLVGDMMDMRSPETAWLIWRGFKEENIKNPFIKNMVEKNEFSLNKAEYKSYKGKISPMGAAFFIVPFLNATVRSGTAEEKRLVFESMLEDKAHQIILSNKRGHKPGETEELITQVLRLVTNIKNRQTKAQDAAVEMLEKRIEQDNMLQDNVLVFYLPHNAIQDTVAGLCANKLMGKYDRPVCIMMQFPEKDEFFYRGSARGCTTKGLEDFRSQVLKCSVDQAQGHPNAFGISIHESLRTDFKHKIQELAPEASAEKIYNVDFVFDNSNLKDLHPTVSAIAMMNDFWGTGLERSRIALNYKVTKDKVTVYRKKNNTLKINCNNVDAIMFDASEDLCKELETTSGYVDFTFICECLLNEFGCEINPQLKIIDYKINNRCKYVF